MSNLYAVVGNPVEHSLSPFIHKNFAEQTNKRVIYKKMHAKSDSFCDDVRKFFSLNGIGLNITLPFKQVAYNMAQSVSTRAETAGAVNTLFYYKRQLYGDNTDGAGFINDLQNKHISLLGKKVLIIGAGGASSGIIPPILAEHPNLLVITNRTPENAQNLARSFSYLGGIVYQDLNNLNSHFDLVINATSISCSDFSFLPPHIASGAVCYDLSYNNTDDTAFNLWADSQGAVAIFDGIGMLVEQAAEAFYLWHGVRPNTKDVLDKLVGNKLS